MTTVAMAYKYSLDFEHIECDTDMKLCQIYAGFQCIRGDLSGLVVMKFKTTANNSRRN